MIDIPCIVTKRLLLRAPLESDLPAMNDFLSKESRSFISDCFDKVGAWRALLGSIGHWRLRSFRFWHIEQCKSRKMPSTVGFINHFDWPETELGWNVHYVFEVESMAYATMFATRCFWETHLNLPGMISFIDPANARSAALAIRLTAAFEKTYRFRDYDCHVYRHLVGEPSRKVTQSETNQ